MTRLNVTAGIEPFKTYSNCYNIDICTDGEPQTADYRLLLSQPLKLKLEIIPVLTTIVKMSLRIGIMPSHLNGAHVRPVIKPSVYNDILNNLPYLYNKLNVLLLRDYRLTCLSIISASPTIPRTSQITVSRRPLSVYRMTPCVQCQWTIRTLSLCCFWTCRLHLILLITT